MILACFSGWPGSVHYSVACPVLIWFKKIHDDSKVLVSVGAQMNVSHAVSRVYFTFCGLYWRSHVNMFHA